MSPIVVDCSVAIAWTLADERRDDSLSVLRHVMTHGAVVPAIWALEVSNILRMSCKRDRLSLSDALVALERFGAMPITIVGPTLDARLISLAHQHDLTAYDASYLLMAKDRQLPLLTFDQKLLAAATSEGVTTTLPADSTPEA